MNWIKRQFEKTSASTSLDDAYVALVAEKYDVAIAKALSALQFYESTADTARMSRCLNILADGYLGAKDFAHAEHAYQKSLALIESTGEKSNLVLIASLTGLGEAKRLGGDVSGAEEPLRRAVELIDSLALADQSFPEGAQTLNGLACILVQKGKYDEAKQLFERALKMIENPPKGLPILQTLRASVEENYAELLRAMGKAG